MVLHSHTDAIVREIDVDEEYRKKMRKITQTVPGCSPISFIEIVGNHLLNGKKERGRDF